MTRKSIFEVLQENYNPQKELERICSLFYINGIIQDFWGNSFTIEGFVDKNLFFNWKSRGTYISCKDIRHDLNIDTFPSKKMTVEEIVSWLEYYMNIIQLVVQNSSDYALRFIKEFEILNQNIKILIEKLNFEPIKIKDKEQVILIQKNPQGTAVAEISSDETGLAILRYHHQSLKGQLEEKRKILEQISLEYEPIFDKTDKPYNDLFLKTWGLVNTLHVRHNNKSDDTKNTKINLSDKELENWYDDLYQMLLICILINDNIKNKRLEKAKQFFDSQK